MASVYPQIAMMMCWKTAETLLPFWQHRIVASNSWAYSALYTFVACRCCGKRYDTIRYEMLCLVENISETSAMRVAEKQECDPNCHRGSGCSERGEGKCDSYCVTGFGLDPNTYTCMGECDLVARCCSFVDELPSLMNETKPEQIPGSTLTNRAKNRKKKT